MITLLMALALQFVPSSNAQIGHISEYIAVKYDEDRNTLYDRKGRPEFYQVRHKVVFYDTRFPNENPPTNECTYVELNYPWPKNEVELKELDQQLGDDQVFMEIMVKEIVDAHENYLVEARKSSRYIYFNLPQRSADLTCPKGVPLFRIGAEKYEGLLEKLRKAMERLDKALES